GLTIYQVKITALTYDCTTPPPVQLWDSSRGAGFSGMCLSPFFPTTKSIYIPIPKMGEWVLINKLDLHKRHSGIQSARKTLFRRPSSGDISRVFLVAKFPACFGWVDIYGTFT
ncbi:hypothetical protein N7526_004186, partial [Penicillium atrosanguineum]